MKTQIEGEKRCDGYCAICERQECLKNWPYSDIPEESGQDVGQDADVQYKQDLYVLLAL